MIALALMAIALSFLFSAYQQMVRAKTKLERVKEWVLCNKSLQQRLYQLFYNISETGLKEQDKNQPVSENSQTPSLYTTSLPESAGEALAFTYDNGIDPDPSFCHEVEGELYLNKSRSLCLITYPQKGEKRYEILYEGVEKLAFDFFDPTAEETHSSLWDRKRDHLPTIIRMTLSFKGKRSPLQFAFFIPLAESPIVYK
jgi:hypothetical protein